MSNVHTKEKVIRDIIIRLTFDGALQRANIYSDSVDEMKRKQFRLTVALELEKTLKAILAKKDYKDDDHYKVIEDFSLIISTKHADILDGGKLRIGNTQKFINLFWKISWLLKENVLPPIHCPFDSIIIKKLDKSVQKIAWTKFDSISEYQHLVITARKAGKGYSLAEWELNTYKEVVDKYQ